MQSMTMAKKQTEKPQAAKSKHVQDSLVMLIGQPAQLMKILANKAVDVVLNFIITHPPSALIKAAFKAVEAVSGKSIVELVRQYIPFADKLINKIAGSGPVQGLLKPLEQPVKQVGGMIDQVSVRAVGMVNESEQKATGMFGSGAKLLKGLAGVSGDKKAAGSGGDQKAGGGGDFLGGIKSGIHTRLVSFGQKLLKSGKALVKGGIDKVKGLILGPKVKFKIGSEDHELWVEKKGSRNVVMMASEVEEIRKKIKDFEGRLENIGKKQSKEITIKIQVLKGILIELEKNSDKPNEYKLKEAAGLVSEIGIELKGASKTGDDIPRISEIVVRFKRNPKHDAAEFDRQLKGQEEGLNSLTVYEFLQNRDKYIKEGRAPEGSAAQKLARQEALKEKVTELRKQGLSREEANKQAEEWIKGQAALHNPDQIAGGNALDITGMGDTRINSSIGSQWKNKVGEFDRRIRNMTTKMSDTEKRATRLNVKLTY